MSRFNDQLADLREKTDELLRSGFHTITGATSTGDSQPYLTGLAAALGKVAEKRDAKSSTPANPISELDYKIGYKQRKDQLVLFQALEKEGADILAIGMREQGPDAAILFRLDGDPTTAEFLDVHLGGRFTSHPSLLQELRRLKLTTHRSGQTPLEKTAVLAVLGYEDIFAKRIAETVAAPLHPGQAITFIGPDTSLSRRTSKHFSNSYSQTLSNRNLGNP